MFGKRRSALGAIKRKGQRKLRNKTCLRRSREGTKNGRSETHVIQKERDGTARLSGLFDKKSQNPERERTNRKLAFPGTVNIKKGKEGMTRSKAWASSTSSSYRFKKKKGKKKENKYTRTSTRGGNDNSKK